MNRTLAMRRLWWKEGKQLWPLLALLLAMGAVLHLLFLMTPSYGITERPTLLFLALPGLFAVGAGALLVGQEKELRTLNWLSSLPVAAKDIVRIKLGAGMCGLVLVWLVSLLMLLIAEGLEPNRLKPTLALRWPLDRGESVFVWPLHSLFLLITGFAMAWRFKSSLVSLLVIVPIACLPTVFASLVSPSLLAMDPAQFALDQPLPLSMTISLVLFISALLWYGWTVGLRNLSPDSSNHARPRLTGFSSSFYPQSTVVLNAPLSPIPALVWQFAGQNKSVLLGTGGMIVSAAFLLAGNWNPDEMPAVLAMLLIFLATCWLAVTTFQGDQIQQRIRFLADRGVSPRQVWLTRQILPMAIVFFIVIPIALVGASYRVEGNPPIPVVLGFLATLFAVYAASQWTGQIVRSPIVAAILAPVFSGIAISYAIFAISTLAAPLWLVAVCVALPFIATFCLMSRWMDSRTGLVYWFSHGMVFTLCALLPAIPLLVAILTQPGMPRAAARQFAEEAKRWSAFQDPPQELMLSSDRRIANGNLEAEMLPTTDDADDLAASFPPKSDAIEPSISQTRAAHFRYLRQQLSERSGSFMHSRAIDFLRTEVVLARLKLVGGELTDGELVEERRDRYRTAVELLTEIVKRMRLSPRLIEQEGADQIEIGLLSELKQSASFENLGQEVYSSVVRMLANSKARNEARRRAVVLSWAEYQQRSDTKNGNPFELGGITLANSQGATSVRDWLVSKRKAAHASWLLMQYLDTGSVSGQAQLLTELASAWDVSPSYYNTVSQSTGLLAAVPISFSVNSSSWRRAPGKSWFGRWEQVAAELVNGTQP